MISSLFIKPSVLIGLSIQGYSLVSSGLHVQAFLVLSEWADKFMYESGGFPGKIALPPLETKKPQARHTPVANCEK
jgi:hypothetical protein